MTDESKLKWEVVKEEDISPPSAHKHTKNDITDFPTSLPADGGTADRANTLNVIDNRSVDDIPDDFFGADGKKIYANFKYKSSVGNPPVKMNNLYVFIITVAGWSDPSGGYPFQLALGTNGLAYRYGISREEWSSWTKIANA